MDELALEEELLNRELAKLSLKGFIDYTFDDYIFGDFHDELFEALEAVERGELKRLIVQMPPRVGKCIHPETKILTRRGYVFAEQMEEGDIVFSEKEGEVVEREVLGVGTAFKPCLKIKTRSGREIIVSDDHRMLTQRGYVEARELKSIDFFRSCNFQKSFEGIDILEDEVVFVSNMIFEGCCGKCYSYTNTDEIVYSEFLNACDSLGIGHTKDGISWKINHNIGRGGKLIISPLKNIMEKYKLNDHLCYTKRIPSQFFFMSDEMKWKFVDIMFATDGWFDNDHGGVALANENLIDDIQMLLSMLGIVSSKTYKRNDHAGVWSLNIGRSQIQKILDNCSLYHKRHKAEEIVRKAGISLTNVYPNELFKNLVGTRVNKVRTDNDKNISYEKFERIVKIYPEMERIRNKDFFWDKIISIEEVQTTELIDLQVEETENFVANGFISHNTEIISKRFPAWILGRNPKKKVIGTSYGAELATKNSRETRRIVQEKKYRNVFEGFGLSDEKKESGNWETKKNGGYYSAGVSGALTGFGFDIGIIDDYVKDREQAESPTIREKIWDWYTSTFYTRKQGEDSAIIVLATRWHVDDLIGRLLKNEDGDDWKVISFPALNDKDESFFPERFSTQYYKDERNTIGVRDFAALYQQDPITAMGAIFKKEDFRYYALSDIDSIKERFDVAIICDPAFSSRQSSDDTVVIAMARHRDTGEYYELDRYAGTIPPSEGCVVPVNMAWKWKNAGFHVQFISVEDVSINKDQKLFVNAVDAEMRKQQLLIPLKRFMPRIKKEDRIRFKLEPVIARGSYYFRVDDSGNRSWVTGEEQLLRFPNSKHDDIIDTIAQGIEQFEKSPNSEQQINSLAMKRRQVALYRKKLVSQGVKL